MFFGTQTINEQGHLEVGGCDTVELAANFSTPLYVVDEEALRQRCIEYRAAFERRAPGASATALPSASTPK